MKKNIFEQPTIESESIESLSAKLLTTTAQLTETNRELQKIQKERSEMLANISHDLRAPITAIRSSVDYLLSGKELTAEDYTSSLKLIDRRTKTLEDLIQDMYYLFCVEDTSKKLTLATVDAAFFLEEYFYDAIVDTRYDEHNMNLEIDENVRCTIQIDLQKIVRVFDNLFTNAAKYSPSGTDITVKAALLEGFQMIQVSVVDNGIGIPEAALEYLFSRTYTVSSARTPNSATGSGLGLSIVKAIIERHGGTVSCESEEGKGSCFSFTLPCIP
uniref:sensor histidine kinase n=1 Tax=Acetatifactor sp. TaxID=1872090 RepID=UPI004056365B